MNDVALPQTLGFKSKVAAPCHTLTPQLLWQEWGKALGQPTCLEEVGPFIVVGGSSGALVCISSASISGAAGEGTFELQESKTYLGSFFGRYVLVLSFDLLEYSSQHIACHVSVGQHERGRASVCCWCSCLHSLICCASIFLHGYRVLLTASP